MEYQQLAFERRSIRGFRPNPIPKALLGEIISVAAQAPSSMNTQPWHVHAVAGDVLDRIRGGNTERMLETGKPDREIRGHGRYEGDHRERQKRVAAQLFDAAGIGWDDKAQRQDWAMRGFRQFDAPVSVIGCIDRDLYDSTEAYFDLGQFVYGMVLAAWDRGVGCVINGQGISQSSVVREHANIPDDQLIVITVAMGFPDDSFAANGVVSERRPVSEIATYRGFGS
ncbi:MAG: nitroreductase [Acidimicrobiales bacterium]|nr:nitroreductase [Acidimicrobiales bacterium]MDG1876870.1 nitroreductase [Acidimicrobiales bacterium]